MPAACAARRCSGSREAGYTTIELVCVIIILGILAANALPRYQSLEDEAHRVVLAQTAAAVGTAVRQAYYGCVVAGYAGRDNLATFGNGTLDFNASCFPASTNGNNGNVNANRCLQVWNGILLNPPSISTPASDITDYRAQGSGTTCTYTYRRDEDTVRRFTYSSATGLITITANP